MEVYHIGEWGTIGDYNWNLKDAQVVCNELGYGTAIAATTDSYFGRGKGRTWLDNVYCAGTEWSIGDCSHSNWNYGYSSHYNDVGVQCTTGNVLIIACINICQHLASYLSSYSPPTIQATVGYYLCLFMQTQFQLGSYIHACTK